MTTAVSSNATIGAPTAHEETCGKVLSLLSFLYSLVLHVSMYVYVCMRGCAFPTPPHPRVRQVCAGS
jgi:hypothetical protein